MDGTAFFVETLLQIAETLKFDFKKIAVAAYDRALREVRDGLTLLRNWVIVIDEHAPTLPRSIRHVLQALHAMKNALGEDDMPDVSVGAFAAPGRLSYHFNVHWPKGQTVEDPEKQAVSSRGTADLSIRPSETISAIHLFQHKSFDLQSQTGDFIKGLAFPWSDVGAITSIPRRR